MDIDDDYGAEGFSLIGEGQLVEVVDIVEHVADMLRDEPGGDGSYGRLRVCEAALRHTVDLLSVEADRF